MNPRAVLAVAYATGRASHSRQVKGDDTDKNEHPGPPGWGFGVGLTTPHSKKLTVTKVEQRKKLDRLNDDRTGKDWIHRNNPSHMERTNHAKPWKNEDPRKDGKRK